MTKRGYLGRARMLVKTVWAGWLKVPTFNMDVAVGAIRYGIIEPWTTWAAQELIRPRCVYVNVGSNFGYYVALWALLLEIPAKSSPWNQTPMLFRIFDKRRAWTIGYGAPTILCRAGSSRDSASSSKKLRLGTISRR
jgi:hypothetical protein